MNKTKIAFLENKQIAIVALVLITYAVYLKCLFFDFSPMDEDWLITRNIAFLENWGNIISAFNDAVQGLYYRPVLIVTFIIDYHFGHLNPFIYHFTNVLMHTLCVIVLYKFLLEIKTEKSIAFFLAIIFSVHPIALQAVAWIPGRNDLLLGLFTISACYHLIKYINTGNITNAVLNVLFFLMALFTKENSIFLFPIFIFIFFIFKPADTKKLMAFVIIWIIGLMIWYFMLTAVVKTTLSTGPIFLNTLKYFSCAILMFIGKSVIPINQSVAPIADNVSVIIGIIAILLTSFLLFKLGVENKKMACLGLGIYFVLLIVPVWFGATLPLGEHLEHRVYTSMIGLIILVGQIKFTKDSKMVSGIFIIIILLFATKTFIRADVYKGSLSYISEASDDCPENYFYQSTKGNCLFDKGDFHGALNSFNSAIALYSKRPQIYNYRANAYVALGKKDEAIADLTKAYELSGLNPEMLEYRWLIYKRFGDTKNAFLDSIALRTGKVLVPQADGATKELGNTPLSEINKLIASEPLNALFYVNRAKIYMDLRRGPEALADLKKACELDPKNQEYRRYFNELNSTLPH